MTPFALFPPEIPTHILSFMSIAELSAFASACRSHRIWVMQLLNRRKDQALLRFVSDPIHLLNTIRSTSSVISGSFALQFIVPAADFIEWQSSDMDIYTTGAGSGDLLALFIKEGYATVTHVKHNHYSNPAIHAVTTLSKGRRSIDVVISRLNYSTFPIFYFHSTIVMNFITADSIFSAYPMLTANYRGLRNPLSIMYDRHPDVTLAALEKYKILGFSIQSHEFSWPRGDTSAAWHCCGKSYNCRGQMRNTSDQGCLRLYVEKPGTIACAETGVLIDLLNWRLGGGNCLEGGEPWPSYVY
ncbi:hypothetical protein BJ138DRAFT_1016379 [Hygrophoropsis aurantiaca]|uniref:Uncharacterized protein n=1 Tax=Hygrophoropsis aurantiaca TaxID=72124 RepID=A0ACB8A0B1_9AGAM|nr:hypothetical protein BJ138DRAFT_1016379 [Hygrophoropsis aurantiaca]